MKTLKIVLFVILANISFVNLVLCQNLKVNIFPEEIDENYNSNIISIKIKNELQDTVFIAIDPLNSDFVTSYEYRLFETFSFYYQPNRIIFFKTPYTSYFEALSLSNISFIKFPRILIITPNENAEFVIRLDDNILKTIKKNKWKLKYIICYSIKKEIYDILAIKSEDLKKEFEKSIIKTDKIYLSMMYHNQVLEKTLTSENIVRENTFDSIQLFDSSLYYYKNSGFSRDSIYYKTCYDSVIYMFNHTIKKENQ